MDARDWHFPMLCPACQAVAGVPYRSAMEDKFLSIDLRCGDCQHEWSITTPSPAVVLTPKKERRKSLRLPVAN